MYLVRLAFVIAGSRRMWRTRFFGFNYMVMTICLMVICMHLYKNIFFRNWMLLNGALRSPQPWQQFTQKFNRCRLTNLKNLYIFLDRPDVMYSSHIVIH